MLRDWGLVPYQKAWLAQKALVAERITNNTLEDTLILLEHPPVYTLGTGASTDFLKFDYRPTRASVGQHREGGSILSGSIGSTPEIELLSPIPALSWCALALEGGFPRSGSSHLCGIISSNRDMGENLPRVTRQDHLEQFDLKREVYRVERGGEVTYHCPGQLIGYPILNLRYYQQDLHWYLRKLEAVIIKTVEAYGLDAYQISGLTGVWLEGKKIAAIGIKVRRWITMHGFALNVCPDLQGFQDIVPCGITDKPVGSLSEFMPNLTVAEVRVELVRSFTEVFNVEIRNSLD